MDPVSRSDPEKCGHQHFIRVFFYLYPGVFCPFKIANQQKSELCPVGPVDVGRSPHQPRQVGLQSDLRWRLRPLRWHQRVGADLGADHLRHGAVSWRRWVEDGHLFGRNRCKMMSGFESWRLVFFGDGKTGFATTRFFCSNLSGAPLELIQVEPPGQIEWCIISAKTFAHQSYF